MVGIGDMMRYQKEHKAWQERFDLLAPKPGDVAPDFQLRDIDGENPLRLSDMRGVKPVALTFGNYT
jgi:hypothetical protein